MKKFLRFIGVLLLIVAAGVVVMGLIAPKDISVERSIAINAPKAVVEDQMFQYKNFKNWSPWQELDPKMESNIIGPERTAGTKYTWKGNKDVGSGEMITKETGEGEMKYAMIFREPFESEANGYWRVEDGADGKSRAVWGFTTHTGFPMNGLMMLFGMKNHLEKDFDKGLGKLKVQAEAHANDAPASAFNIQPVQFPGHSYATIRQTINIYDMGALHQFFMKSYEALGKAAGQRIAGPASALYYKWDEKTGTADMAAAFPVSGNGAVNGMQMQQVAASKGYQVNYVGGYYGSGKAHEALGKYIAAHGEKQGMVIEEYLKGPGEEKDSTKWVTNIIYLVQ